MPLKVSKRSKFVATIVAKLELGLILLHFLSSFLFNELSSVTPSRYAFSTANRSSLQAISFSHNVDART